MGKLDTIFIFKSTNLFHVLCVDTTKKNLKYISLFTLVIQNSALILLMRYTRASVPSNQLYLASTAVLMSEVIKTCVCLVVVYRLLPTYHQSITKLCSFLYRELIIQHKETIKLALPAILYLIQVSKGFNNVPTQKKKN
jgi:hypothetical protein